MISYKVKGIILAVIISLASIMMPFSVYADDYTGSTVVGFNTVYKETTVINGSSQYNYVEEFILDDSYVGYLNVSFVVNYYDQNGNSASYTFYGGNRYVNGSKFEVPFFITGQSYYSSERPAINNVVVTYGNHNLVKHSTLNDLDQIINLLTDLYNNTDGIEGLENSQLSALQNIVSNTSLANTYLQKILQLRNYNFPIESFNAISYLFDRYEIVDYYNYGSWKYPLFKVPANSSIGQLYFYSGNTNTERNLIVIGNFHANSNPFTINNGQYIGYYEISYNQVYGIWKIRFKGMATGGGFTSITTNRELLLCPVFLGLITDNNLSTDFALEFGLSNRLLDDIHLIASGTNQSNSSASNLENEASEYSDIADDVIGVEEGLTSNFETSVNQIDLNTGLSGFGGNFMTSATWVRTQFDRLTENTPYGSLVVYGLTLGFALLMLGKVFL